MTVGANGARAPEELLGAIPPDGRGTTVTVGTFDGVHLGHQQVLAEVVGRAARTDRRSVLVTFEPHPLQVVRPNDAPPLLCTEPEKKELLAQSGLRYATFLPFTRALQNYSARQFVQEILVRRFAMRELVIGYDHGFGRGREGSVQTMRSLGAEVGFTVAVVEAVMIGDAAVSSTRIRRALAAGDVEQAATGLGRPYALSGRVVHGEKRGRELGFPTANLAVRSTEKMIPSAGIYAVRAWVGGTRHDGVLHVGPRPVFGSSTATVELHLLDFTGDLYEQRVLVEFHARIRDVLPFPSVEQMVERMHEDVRVGRDLLTP